MSRRNIVDLGTCHPKIAAVVIHAHASGLISHLHVLVLDVVLIGGITVAACSAVVEKHSPENVVVDRDRSLVELNASAVGSSGEARNTIDTLNRNRRADDSPSRNANRQ